MNPHFWFKSNALAKVIADFRGAQMLSSTSGLRTLHCELVSLWHVLISSSLQLSLSLSPAPQRTSHRICSSQFSTKSSPIQSSCMCVLSLMKLQSQCYISTMQATQSREYKTTCPYIITPLYYQGIFVPDHLQPLKDPDSMT